MSYKIQGYHKPDPYMGFHEVYGRLRKEYVSHGKLILAVDFDDTLYDTHKNGWTYDMVKELVRGWAPYAYIIIWTASDEDRYPFIREYLEKEKIPYDAINEDCPGVPVKGRKIYANAVLDDRAGLMGMHMVLDKLLTEIKEGKLSE